jgi:hypothetical protein
LAWLKCSLDKKARRQSSPVQERGELLKGQCNKIVLGFAEFPLLKKYEKL